MEHAVTVGMVIWASLATLAVIAVLGGIVFVLSVIASGFKH